VLVLSLAYVEEIPDIVLSAGAVLLAATLGVALLRYHVLASAVAFAGALLVVIARGPRWLQWLGLDEDGLRLARIAAVFLCLALACVLAYVVSQGPRMRFRREEKRRRAP